MCSRQSASCLTIYLGRQFTSSPRFTHHLTSTYDNRLICRQAPLVTHRCLEHPLVHISRHPPHPSFASQNLCPLSPSFHYDFTPGARHYVSGTDTYAIYEILRFLPTTPPTVIAIVMTATTKEPASKARSHDRNTTLSITIKVMLARRNNPNMPPQVCGVHQPSSAQYAG